MNFFNKKKKKSRKIFISNKTCKQKKTPRCGCSWIKMLKVKMSSLFPLAERFIINIKYYLWIFTSRESTLGTACPQKAPNLNKKQMRAQKIPRCCCGSHWASNGEAAGKLKRNSFKSRNHLNAFRTSDLLCLSFCLFWKCKTCRLWVPWPGDTKGCFLPAWHSVFGVGLGEVSSSSDSWARHRSRSNAEDKLRILRDVTISGALTFNH